MDREIGQPEDSEHQQIGVCGVHQLFPGPGGWFPSLFTIPSLFCHSSQKYNGFFLSRGNYSTSKIWLKSYQFRSLRRIHPGPGRVKLAR